MITGFVSEDVFGDDLAPKRLLKSDDASFFIARILRCEEILCSFHFHEINH
jgi:hypothetical protein